MEARELFTELEMSATSRTHFFGRALIALPRSAFESYLEHFNESFNPLNGRANYRTRHTFTYIHAVEDGGLIECHIDFFNPTMFLPLALPHLFVSVIPYFLWCLLTLKRPYKIYS